MTLFGYYYESLNWAEFEKELDPFVLAIVYKEFRPVRNLSRIVNGFSGAVPWGLTE